MKIQGIIQTQIPTGGNAGNESDFSVDKFGRQVMWPLQVRGLEATARASMTTGAETTLLQSDTGTFSDMMLVMAVNESGAAQTLDFRSATAGGIAFSVRVPADSTSGATLSYPYPQGVAGDTWTVQNSGSDISNTTIKVSALFIKNKNA